MTTLVQIDSEIQQLQTRIQALQQQRDQLADDLNVASSRRPAGIPPSWKPRFDGSGPSLRVYAWFDPNKMGENPNL